MTKTMTFEELKMVYGGVGKDVLTETDKHFKFWDAVACIDHPEYGVGHVLMSGYDYTVVSFSGYIRKIETDLLVLVEP